MTTFRKTTPYGLEFPIDKLQTHLDSELTWSGTNNIYGILFKNDSQNGIVLEAWSSGDEYKPVFNNDKVTSEIAFLPLDRNVISHVATVQIIVTVNLETAYGSNVRDSERAYLEIQNIIQERHRIEEGSFKQGVPSVFGGTRIDNIDYLDMQPFDVFSFDIIVSYPNDVGCQ